MQQESSLLITKLKLPQKNPQQTTTEIPSTSQDKNNAATGWATIRRRQKNVSSGMKEITTKKFANLYYLMAERSTTEVKRIDDPDSNHR